MLCLNIRQQYGQIDIRTQRAEMDIRTEQPKLDMASEAAVLEISREKGELNIDATPSRYAIGIKNNADFSKDAAQEGMQAIQEFTARIVDVGNQIVEGKGNPPSIPEIIYNNSIANCPMPRIEVKYITLPDISYTPDKLHITYKKGRTNINFQPTNIETNVRPASVEITLAKEPNIRMWVSEGKFDIYA